MVEERGEQDMFEQQENDLLAIVSGLVAAF